MTHDLPFPNGWRLIPDKGLRRRDNGKVLLGGSPFRLLRLSKAGSKQVSEWFAGAPIGTGAPATKLARRLLSTGMAHPMPTVAEKQPLGTGTRDPDITIVIPVKDDLGGLVTTLAGLFDSGDPLLPIIIVDDGSRNPVSGQDLGTSTNVQIIRNEPSVGPGSARNRGFEGVSTELVAFVDAGVILDHRDLLQLARHLADLDVVAAAPRVQSSLVDDHSTSRTSPAKRSGAIAQYERSHSPLDLGQQPASVKPGSRVSYVPTACLLIRSAALQHISEASFVFDPSLRYGEDVDLEWRLGDEGTIRYDPSIVVAHPPRTNIVAFAQQRLGYGSAAAPLAERHGQIVAPFRSSPWSLALLVLVLTGHPVVAGLVASRSSILTSQKLQGRLPDHQVEAVRVTTAGHVTSGIALGQTTLRSWWPAALVGLAVPFLRPAVSRLISWGFVAKIWHHRQDQNKVVQVAIGLLDDLSYGVGLWQGALSERSPRALWPDLGPLSMDKSL